MKPVITRVVEGGVVSVREKGDPKDMQRVNAKVVRVLPSRQAVIQVQWIISPEQYWSVVDTEDTGFAFAVGKITNGSRSSVTLKWHVPEDTIVDRNAKPARDGGQSDSDRGRGPSPRTA